MVEACGLRCHYHGWLFDGAGRCLEQPFEDVAHPDGTLPGQDPDHRLSGRGQGGAAVGLPRPGARAARAGLGPLRRSGLQADRLLRDPVQLVPGAGELDRPHPLRVAAQQLDGGAARGGRPGAAPPQDRLRRVRVGLRLPPRARGLDRAGRSVDRRPRVPLAELSVHRQVRVARADRRRAHAARGVVQRSRARLRRRSRRSASRTGSGPSPIRPPAATSPAT